MTNNPNELTIETSVLAILDHQPWVALMVHSIDPGLMINNVAGLAQAARNLGVPTILTTIGAKGSILVDPLFKEMSEIFPDVTPIDRTSTHAWASSRLPMSARKSRCRSSATSKTFPRSNRVLIRRRRSRDAQ